MIRNHLQPVSTHVNLFGIAAALTAFVLSIAVAQKSFVVIAAIAALGFVILVPVEASLGLFAFFVPFESVLLLGDSGATLSWATGALAGGVLLVHGLIAGRLQSPPRTALWWGLFVLWAAFSCLWALNPSASVEFLPRVLTLFALYLVAISFRISKGELSRVFMLTALGGAFAAALVIGGFARNIGHLGRASLIIGDQESNPNGVAASLLLPFSLMLGNVLRDGRFLKRAVWLVMLGLLASAIFLTMSRGGLISLAAVVAVFVLRARVRRRMLVPILLVALPLLFMPDLFYQRLQEAPESRGTGRFDIWTAGLEVVKDNPIAGAGLRNFREAYDKVAGYAPVFRGYNRAAHSIYLDIWADMGLIGLALFCAGIWSQMAQLRRAVSNHVQDYLEIAIEAACWGLLVQGLSGSIEWNKPFWLDYIFLNLIARQKQPESELSWSDSAGSDRASAEALSTSAD